MTNLSIKNNNQKHTRDVRSIVKNTLYTLGILTVFFIISLLMDEWLNAHSSIPAVFTLAVFLISLVTGWYVYGIVASLISVLALNYAFTFPYFKFNFTIHENLVSAIIMLIITIVAGTLAAQLKQQEKVKIESAKEKMRANLLRAVSHDLRTPLTTIYGSGSAIAADYSNLNREQILQLANGIKEDSQWLMGMVENLLSVTRIDDGDVKIVKTPVVLEELIDAALVRFKKRYPEQAIEVDIPEEFISIPMDVVLIQQVIVNLLENAVQHAEGMTRLELKVFTIGDTAVFEISDDGCGVAKDKIANIFTGYFENKDTPIDSNKRNMGIGLSVCASIIKAHEGNIGVVNKKTGGSCFRFSLSLEESGNE